MEDLPRLTLLLLFAPPSSSQTTGKKPISSREGASSVKGKVEEGVGWFHFGASTLIPLQAGWEGGSPTRGRSRKTVSLLPPRLFSLSFPTQSLSFFLLPPRSFLPCSCPNPTLPCSRPVGKRKEKGKRSWGPKFISLEKLKDPPSIPSSSSLILWR